MIILAFYLYPISLRKQLVINLKVEKITWMHTVEDCDESFLIAILVFYCKTYYTSVV